jgi:hypothetical protein
MLTDDPMQTIFVAINNPPNEVNENAYRTFVQFWTIANAPEQTTDLKARILLNPRIGIQFANDVSAFLWPLSFAEWKAVMPEI